MNAEQYLNVALGGNMNISTLKPLAWHEIMEGYARHKLAEAQPQADNSAMDAISKVRNMVINSGIDNSTPVSEVLYKLQWPSKQHQ